MPRPRSRYQIDRELLALYDRIKFERADARCECQGECGRSHKFGVHRRCPNLHGRPAVHGGDKTVSLAVRYLDDDKHNNDERNLLAMCQTCVARHRGKVNAQTERATSEPQHESLFAEFAFGTVEIGPHL